MLNTRYKMSRNNRELQRDMRSKEDEGMAPYQSLAHLNPELVPRPVDRLYPAEFERNRDPEKEGKMKYTGLGERLSQPAHTRETHPKGLQRGGELSS